MPNLELNPIEGDSIYLVELSRAILDTASTLKGFLLVGVQLGQKEDMRIR